MKIIKSLLVLCLLSFGAFAQQNTSTIKIKLYNQSSFVKNERNYRAATNINLKTEKKINIFSPKFAIAYTAKNGNTHELEINRFELNFNSEKDEPLDSLNSNIVGGQEVNNLNFSFRYEYTPASKKSRQNKKSMFSVSYGVQPYVYNRKTIPLITTNFPESNTQIGASGYIAPRFTYQLSEKLFFDVNLPFNLIDFNFTAIEIEDPTKIKSQRNTYSTNFNTLPMNYNLRIGLAYRI
jgi:hypothetical protein